MMHLDYEETEDYVKVRPKLQENRGGQQENNRK
jgi:hypothetical protein